MLEKHIEVSAMLPQLRTIKQPNKVTYASYDFTLMQHRVFSYIMLHLQDYVNIQLRDKTSVNQLSLFKDNKTVEVRIVLKEFVSNNNYKLVIDSIRSLSSCWVKFPDSRGKDGVVYEQEKVLVSGLSFSKDKNNKVVVVEIEKGVAERILNVQQGYTRFAFEIAFNCKNKYTSRIYQLICRWRDTGGFRLKYEELRAILSIPKEKYKDWNDFKKRIIKDVQKELNPDENGILKSDVWFEVEIEKGENSQYLNFKVITPEKIQQLNKKRENILEVLKYHFGYSENDYKPISKLLISPTLYSDVYQKLIDLKETLSSHREVTNVPAYINASLLKQFKSRLK